MSKFYLTSRHGDCGTNVMFHRTNGNGYTTDLDDIKVIDLEKAQECVDRENGEIPLLKSEVDKLAIRAVDCQYLDETKSLFNPAGLYVIQIERCWNGNDIAFAVIGGKTFNYDHAWRDSLSEIKKIAEKTPNSKIWPVDYLDTICRRTFQRENINIRKMIIDPGIKYKNPRKPRSTTGKVRWNCPACGKINWQYNPHDFDGCSDILCGAH